MDNHQLYSPILQTEYLAMIQFWELEIEPIINKLIKDEHPFEEIQNFFNEDYELIERVYQANKIDIIPVLCLRNSKGFQGYDGNYMQFLCLIKERTEGLKKLIEPCVIINIPGLFRLFSEVKKFFWAMDYRHMFECAVLVGFMHELDHLALDKARSPKNFSQLLDYEVSAWARTCNNTIRVLSECFPDILPLNILIIYYTWTASGKDIQSRIWKDCIANMYNRYAF